MSDLAGEILKLPTYTYTFGTSGDSVECVSREVVLGLVATEQTESEKKLDALWHSCICPLDNCEQCEKQSAFVDAIEDECRARRAAAERQMKRGSGG